jgi:hypothetical protein
LISHLHEFPAQLLHLFPIQLLGEKETVERCNKRKCTKKSRAKGKFLGPRPNLIFVRIKTPKR